MEPLACVGTHCVTAGTCNDQSHACMSSASICNVADHRQVYTDRPVETCPRMTNTALIHEAPTLRYAVRETNYRWFTRTYIYIYIYIHTYVCLSVDP